MSDTDTKETISAARSCVKGLKGKTIAEIDQELDDLMSTASLTELSERLAYLHGAYMGACYALGHHAYVNGDLEKGKSLSGRKAVIEGIMNNMYIQKLKLEKENNG